MGTRRRYKLLFPGMFSEGGSDKTYFKVGVWNHMDNWKKRKPVLCNWGLHCYFHPLQAFLERGCHVSYRQNVMWAVDVKGLNVACLNKEAWTAMKLVKRVSYKKLCTGEVEEKLKEYLLAVAARYGITGFQGDSAKYISRAILSAKREASVRNAIRNAVIRAYNRACPIE